VSKGESLVSADKAEQISPTVLVVDDEEDTLRIRKDLLSENGFVPVTASSQQQAITELKAHPEIDLIVVDVNLDPSKRRDTSGVDLARRVKQGFGDLPVIGYSAYFAEDELPKDQWLVFDRHLPKGRSGAQQILTELDVWKALALDSRSKKHKERGRLIGQLTNEYAPEPDDVALLQSITGTPKESNGSGSIAGGDDGDARNDAGTFLDRISELEARIVQLEKEASRPRVVVIREIPRAQAKEEIRQLFHERGTLDYEDIIDELQLDLELTVELCNELIQEGEIGPDA
jgi:CheY-like chemotaxis protein